MMKTMELPNDVISGILSRAPVKSLLRFRSVCKYWSYLIRDPKFIRLHFRHRHGRINDNMFFLMPTRSQIVYSMRCNDVLINQSSPKTTVKMDYYSLHPLSNCDKEIRILGSCNGLIYFQQHHLRSQIGGYFLWNPCTRELKRLPQPGNRCVLPYFLGECTRVHGFGYDHIIDDYKVVRVTYFYCAYDIDQYINRGHNYTLDHLNEVFYTSKVIDVYTLRSNSWRTIESNPLENDECGIWSIQDRPGLYVNGALHWRKVSPLKLVTVTAYDISKEEIQEIQLPNSVSELSSSYLSVLDECLCIFRMNDYYDKGLVDLWMMKVYGVKESWTKLFTIDMINMTPLRMGFVELPWYYSNPLMYHSNDGGILIVFGRKHVVAYDPKKNKARYDHNIADYHYRGGCVVASYVGSLVSLNSGKYLTVAGSITKLTAETRAGSSERRIRHDDEENTNMKKQKTCSYAPPN